MMAEALQTLTEVMDTGLPVYISENYYPCAWLKQGLSPHKVIICSIPRAGTYLTAKLLSLAGTEHVRLHLMHNAVGDYRFATVNLKERQPSPETLIIQIPYQTVLRLIKHGQFLVSHLDCSDETKQDLVNFKKIFVYRDLRDALVSHMRAGAFWKNERDAWENLPEGPARMQEFLLQHGQAFASMFYSIAGWFDDPDVLKLRFEDILGDHGSHTQLEIISNVCEFLATTQENLNGSQLLKDLLDSHTLTWSGERTRRDVCWSGDVQKLFESLALDELNRKFEYQ